MVDAGPLKQELARAGRLLLTVKVIPKSSRNELILLDDGSLKLKITAAPEKGKANAEVCAMLSNTFGVAKSRVRIVRGETSHTKQIEISL